MADEHVFIAHRCGYATYFAKQLANDWTFQVASVEKLHAWLHDNLDEKINSAFWDHYLNNSASPWILLHDRDFNKTWTTPSGLIFNSPDYINGDRATEIFRVKFLDKES